jgi:hypothetical protein
MEERNGNFQEQDSRYILLQHGISFWPSRYFTSHYGLATPPISPGGDVDRYSVSTIGIRRSYRSYYFEYSRLSNDDTNQHTLFKVLKRERR